ncbi:MAG: hypothetical protein V4805_13045 [Pseudomonadota bacterium]
MNRSLFLSLAATVAVAVGLFALLFPAVLLASKGTAPSLVANVWVREVGAILLMIGISAAAMRRHPDSPTLRVFFFSNAMIQLALLLIEVIAYQQGTITLLSGILPNSIIHILLGSGFIYYWRRMPSA